MKFSSNIVSSISFKHALAFALVHLTAVWLLPVQSEGANGVWINTANAAWGNAPSWSGGVPNTAGDIADFSTLDISGSDRTVNLNGNRTAGTLIFGDTVASHDWIIANGGTGTGNRLILTSGIVGVPGVIQVNNRTATISGILDASQGLNKLGAGTLVLNNGANIISGGINISAGTLDFVTGVLGSNLVTFTAASVLGWSTGATQDVSSQIKIEDGVVGTLNSGPGIITLATAFQTGPLGTAGFTKSGAGTFIISGANTYTGATRVNNGFAILTGGNNRLPATTHLGLGNGTSSGVLQLGDATGTSDQTITGLSITGSGTANSIVGGHTSVSTLTLNNAGAVTFNGILGGAGANQNNLELVKNGVGNLTLSNVSSSFTGNVTVNGGRVILRSGNALGGGTKTVYISSPTDNPGLQLDGTTGSFNLPAGISYVTSNDNATAPAILNTAGDNVIAGNIAPTSGGVGTGNTRIKINAGTLTLDGAIAPDLGATGPLSVILDAAVNTSGAANGVIADTGATTLGVSKDGAGVWTLTGANTYTGDTVVNAGRLNISAAQTGGGAISTADGTILGVKLVAVGQSLHTSALTLGGSTGSQLSLNLATVGNPTAPVISAGIFTTNGVNTINIEGTGLSVGDFDLISYTGTIAGSGFSGLTLGTVPARVTANLVDDAASSKVRLNISAFDVPKWTGSTNGVWDINNGPDPTTGTGTVNWREANSGFSTRYLQTGNVIDSVLFDESATGTTTVTLSATLTPATVTVNNTALTYTFSGPGKLSGATSIIKQGPGTLVLANLGGNDNTGITTISAGTLQVGDGVTTGAGQLGSGAVINHGTLVLNRPDDLILANVISGTGIIEKQNLGTMILSGNNGSFDGAVLVGGGVLKLGNANALGTLVGGTTVATGGVLDFTGYNLIEPVRLTGGTLRAISGATNNINGPLALDGGGAIEAYNSTTVILNTAVSGTGGLGKAGNGTAILLSNGNAYTGGTIIRQGVLQVGANGGAGTTGVLGTGDIDFAPATGETATLTILRGDSTLDISNNITSSGAGAHAITIGVTGATTPSGTVTFSGTNSFTGNVTINGGALRITNSSALGAGPKTVRVASNASPTLKLDGSAADIALPAGIDFLLSSDAGSGAIVNVAGNNTIHGTLSIINGGGGQGQITVDAGTLNLAGEINPVGSTGNRTVLLGGAGEGTVSGLVLDDSFALGVSKNGTGIWTLTNDNTHTGVTAVSVGTLRIATIAAIDVAQPLGLATSAITLGTATTTGTFEYTGVADADLERPFTVNGAGGGIIRNSGGALLNLSGVITRAARPLTLTGGRFDVTGQITGAAADLNIQGGTVTLFAATNNYAGPTKVYDGGTLKNGASNSMSPATTVTLGESVNNTSGTYDLNGFDATILSLADAGSGARVVTNSAGSGVNTLSISGAGTYGGLIQDGLTAQTSLTKSGSGTFTLANASTYTGPTTVTGGVLALATTVSIASSALVQTGGALSLAGTVDGDVHVESGGALHAGGLSIIGESTILDSLTLDTDGIVYFEIDGTSRGASIGGYDVINGIHQLILVGTLQVSFGPNYTPVEGDTFNLLDWSFLSIPANVSDQGFVFDFSNAVLGSEYEWVTTDFLTSGTISIAAVTVPEPQRVVLLMLAGLTLTARRRRA